MSRRTESVHRTSDSTTCVYRHPVPPRCLKGSWLVSISLMLCHSGRGAAENIISTSSPAQGCECTSHDRSTRSHIDRLDLLHPNNNEVRWCSWLSRQSNTLKVSGSSPGRIIFLLSTTLPTNVVGHPSFARVSSTTQTWSLYTTRGRDISPPGTVLDATTSLPPRRSSTNRGRVDRNNKKKVTERYPRKPQEGRVTLTPLPSAVAHASPSPRHRRHLASTDGHVVVTARLTDRTGQAETRVVIVGTSYGRSVRNGSHLLLASKNVFSLTTMLLSHHQHGRCCVRESEVTEIRSAVPRRIPLVVGAESGAYPSGP
jgi:hypothetical protein